MKARQVLVVFGSILLRCSALIFCLAALSAAAEESTSRKEAELMQSFMETACDMEGEFVRAYVMCRAYKTSASESLSCYRDVRASLAKEVPAPETVGPDDLAKAVFAKASETGGSIADLWLRKHREEIDKRVLELRELSAQRSTMEATAEIYAEVARKECLRDMEAQRRKPSSPKDNDASG